MKLRNALVALVVLAVLAVAGVVAGVTQAKNGGEHGGFLLPEQGAQQSVPIATFILPDGSIEIEEGFGEFEEATPPGAQ